MEIVSSRDAAAASVCRSRFIPDQSPLSCRPTNFDSALLVQPDVFHTKIVDDAVDHHRPALDPRLPAIREAVEKDDRPGPVLRQLLFDLPYQDFSLPFVGFYRLPVEQLFEFGIAIAGVVARRTAAIVFVELLVRIVDPAAGEIKADLVVLAVHLG